ncbi:MAG: zinc ribbon domain-containing protein [Lactobacillus sp.]|jgi:uncharacterized membrane protein YhaH (DUF805 family)|nr:zinc ribbon domain-containing protein [Lactobacillus sp.]
MKFCQNCGKQLFDTAKFCPYCGVEITAATNSDRDIASRDRFENADYQSAGQPKIVYLNQVQLGFLGSIGYAFKHTFEFTRGPAESRKSVYWWLTLANTIIDFFIFIIYCIDSLAGGLIFVMLGLIMVLPNISTIMRRLKFLGYSPYMVWISLLPSGSFLMLIFMLQSNPRRTFYYNRASTYERN